MYTGSHHVAEPGLLQRRRVPPVHQLQRVAAHADRELQPIRGHGVRRRGLQRRVAVCGPCGSELVLRLHGARVGAGEPDDSGRVRDVSGWVFQ